MIKELEKNQFYKCRDLVNRGVNIEEKAIVEGTNPGRIFVDNIEKPRSGLIWQGNNDGFIFIGDSKNEIFNQKIKSYIDHVIAFQAKEQGLECFECIGNHQSWYITFQEIFNDRKLDSWDQNVYTISPASFKSIEKQQITGNGYVVLKIIKELLDTKEILNLDFLKSKLSEFWESEEKFFDKGIGFCIQNENRIVSICMTGYRYKDIHGIAIETIKPYQGKNLAQRVAYSYVDYCFSNGFMPYWDCMEVNYPSNSVAKSIGFSKEFGYKGYAFKF